MMTLNKLKKYDIKLIIKIKTPKKIGHRFL